MERNRSLYKSVLLDIVSWESRERRGNTDTDPFSEMLGVVFFLLETMDGV